MPRNGRWSKTGSQTAGPNLAAGGSCSGFADNRSKPSEPHNVTADVFSLRVVRSVLGIRFRACLNFECRYCVNRTNLLIRALGYFWARRRVTQVHVYSGSSEPALDEVPVLIAFRASLPPADLGNFLRWPALRTVKSGNISNYGGLVLDR